MAGVQQLSLGVLATILDLVHAKNGKIYQSQLCFRAIALHQVVAVILHAETVFI
jgi:hypothetical protein